MISEENQNNGNLKPIKCQCGCGLTFTPNRRDKKFLNRKHYMDHYNNTTRKNRDRSKKEVFKKLSNNERILKEHYELYCRQNTASCNIDHLIKQGFDDAYSTGFETSEDGKVEFLYSFDFKYSIHNNKIYIQKI